MRTSIDFPDELFRNLKATAAMQSTSLRDHVIALIERGMKASAQMPQAPLQPKATPAIPSISIPGMVWPRSFLASNEQIHALLEQDDFERHSQMLHPSTKSPFQPKAA